MEWRSVDDIKHFMGVVIMVSNQNAPIPKLVSVVFFNFTINKEKNNSYS